MWIRIDPETGRSRFMPGTKPDSPAEDMADSIPQQPHTPAASGAARLPTNPWDYIATPGQPADPSGGLVHSVTETLGTPSVAQIDPDHGGNGGDSAPKA